MRFAECKLAVATGRLVVLLQVASNVVERAGLCTLNSVSQWQHGGISMSGIQPLLYVQMQALLLLRLVIHGFGHLAKAT